jgi:hypothetical protein
MKQKYPLAIQRTIKIIPSNPPLVKGGLLDERNKYEKR